MFPLFSTHIQRKRIATTMYGLHIFSISSFQPISSESGLRHPHIQSNLCFLSSFQPISSESGLRPCPSGSRMIGYSLFNPYPAKADCDLCILQRSVFTNLFSCFSTHIQRKRIATIRTIFLDILRVFLFNPYPAKADCDGRLNPV